MNESTLTGSKTVTSEEERFKINNTYDRKQANFYLTKHQYGFWRILSNRLEQRMAERSLAMAGDPESVLDLPCGAGRFWRLLARSPRRALIAADYSRDMIDTALSFQPPAVMHRFRPLQTSAFDIGLQDGAVECVFSMRLLHHIDREQARRKILQEFHRVSRDTVCLSLWVDGNLQAWRRSLRNRRRARKDQTRFLFNGKKIESEFLACGFDIIGFVALQPALSMWRTYVLRKR